MALLFLHLVMNICTVAFRLSPFAFRLSPFAFRLSLRILEANKATSMVNMNRMNRIAGISNYIVINDCYFVSKSDPPAPARPAMNMNQSPFHYLIRKQPICYCSNHIRNTRLIIVTANPDRRNVIFTSSTSGTFDSF